MSANVSLAPALSADASQLDNAIARGQAMLLKQQAPEGYWWFTLQANETIGSGTILLYHFLGLEQDRSEIIQGLARRLRDEQSPDGSWSLYHGAPGDLSTTVEAYLALRFAGYDPQDDAMTKACHFILDHGGLNAVRIFTRIHLALFGLVPWEACPSMPLWMALLPPFTGFSIYEFSSWARASIVPLLLLLDKKPVHAIPFDLKELEVTPMSRGDWTLRPEKTDRGWKRFFLRLDRVFKWLEKAPWHPGRRYALKVCQRWVRNHLERTEDIFPALNYGILGLVASGATVTDPHVHKALTALDRFLQVYKNELPCDAETVARRHPLSEMRHPTVPAALLAIEPQTRVHQQCCISPLWDTPWSLTALLKMGVAADHPALQQGARYLLSKQIRDFKGDWAIKNPHGPAGGWAFEFENDYFPDVDDTIQIVSVLEQIDLQEISKREVIDRAYAWFISMQCKNGGWAAFDKENTREWVNRIPFSDHGACLDPPTPDITGRAIGLMAQLGAGLGDPVVQHGLDFIIRSQRNHDTKQLGPGASTHEARDCPYGAWWGRWGVNYLYGTWCVLEGLARLGYRSSSPMIARATRWLKAVQCPDGGWGESCAGYRDDCFVALPHGVPSQTAWALMALIAVGEAKSEEVRRGIDFLLRQQNADGSWSEAEHTGTGFPGHFYLRYHGYRHYFPLLALGSYAKYSRK